MKNPINIILITILLCAVNVSVNAQQFFYVGGGIGQSYIEQDNVLANEDFEGDDFAYKAFAEYRFHKNFASEFAYLNLGEPDDDIVGVDTEIEAYAIAMYLVGILPLAEKFEVFGKLGAAYWDAKAKASFMGLSAREDEDGTDIAYGLGATYKITDKYAARAEIEGVDVDDLDKFYIVTVSGELRF